MISFGLIKGEALPLCTRRSGEPHIDNETVSIAPRFQNTTPSYGSVMNQIAKGFPWSGRHRALNCWETTWESAAARAPALDQREEGSGQHYGAWVYAGEVVEQPPGD